MKNPLLHNISSLLILQGSSYLLPLITLPYLVKTLGTEAYGQLGFSLAFIQYFIILTDYGFNLSATRLIAQHQKNRHLISQLFWSIITCKLLIGLTGFIAMLLISQLNPTLYKIQDILLASYLIVLGSILFPVWLFQGMEKMQSINIYSLTVKSLVVPATFFFIRAPDDAWLAAILHGSASIIIGIISALYIKNKKWIIWACPTSNSIRTQLKEGWHIFLSNTAVSIYTNSTIVILGFIAGNTAVGNFVAADKIRQAVQGLINPVTQAVYPRINSLMQKTPAAAFHTIRQLLLYQGGATLLLSLLLASFAPHIIEIVYGPKHEEIIKILLWLSPIPFIVGISNILGIQTMLTLGMKQEFSKILIASGLFNLGLIIPFSLYYGATGAAITILITELLVTYIMGMTLRTHKVKIFQKD